VVDCVPERLIKTFQLLFETDSEEIFGRHPSRCAASSRRLAVGSGRLTSSVFMGSTLLSGIEPDNFQSNITSGVSGRAA
jgi:hypothetical protein